MMRKFNVTVNGKQFVVDVEEVGGVPTYSAPVAQAPAAPPPVAAPVAAAAPAPAPAPAAPAAAPAAVPAGANAIKAPMPGTILDIKVSPGQTIKAGDILMILEAMKMENEILAPCDGVVDSVATSKGATVNTGDLLAVLK